jgi:hypothetical protein
LIFYLLKRWAQCSAISFQNNVNEACERKWVMLSWLKGSSDDPLTFRRIEDMLLGPFQHLVHSLWFLNVDKLRNNDRMQQLLAISERDLTRTLTLKCTCVRFNKPEQVIVCKPTLDLITPYDLLPPRCSWRCKETRRNSNKQPAVNVNNNRSHMTSCQWTYINEHQTKTFARHNSTVEICV